MGKRLSDPGIRAGDRSNFNTNPFSILTDPMDLMHLGFLNLKWAEDSHDFGHNAPTVIMVPGLGCNKGSMSILGNHMKEFANVVYAGNFPMMNTCSIADAAKLLEPLVRQVMQREKNGDVTLVGHSNGGLISLLALHLATDLRVRHVVTMGTPHQGTPHADLLSLVSASCREVNQEGGCLRGANLRGQMNGDIMALVAEKDKIVPSWNQIPSHSMVGRKRTKVQTLDMWHFGFIMGNSAKEVSRIIQKSF